MKQFVIIFVVCMTIIFGSLIVFTFLTTDVPASQIIKDFKSLGTTMNNEITVATSKLPTVDDVIDEFKDKNAGKPGTAEPSIPVGSGTESGFLNDKYPMIWNWPVVEKAGKYQRITSFMSASRAVLGDPPRPHDGMDINPQTPKDKTIKAVAAHHGVVTYSCHGCIASTYGNWVEVEDPRTGYRTRYAHLAERYVRVGDIVKAGQELGLIGSTGRSSGEHLHFEVLTDKVKPGVEVNKKHKQNGKWYDPLAPNITYDAKTKPDGGFKDNNAKKDINIDDKFVTDPGGRK